MEKYSKKLVSKCIYIQILKSTKTDLLCQFMAFNGWSLVNSWLNDGFKSDNWPFVQELLEMLLLCPVDSNRLKSNDTPKVVKNLSLSCHNSSVRCLSKKLVEQWLKIAHQEKRQISASNGVSESKTNERQDLDEHKVNDISQVDTSNGTVLSDSKSEDESSKKQSKDNIKYKVSNKEGSGKLLLSLKRSTSPSAEDKDSKLVKSSVDFKSKSSSDKSKSSSSSSKSSQKDKERSSSNSSSSHHKSSSSKKHSSSKSSSSKSSRRSSSTSSSRDKTKDVEKSKKETEKSQAEKDKETLNLLTPLSSTKLQRIPKRQHSENSENKSAESNKDEGGSPSKVQKAGEAVEKKKPSMSIEVRKGDKPKTVKTLNSQFRNHGLAEEPPKPPSRKDLKKPGTTSTAVISTILPSAAVKTSVSPPPSKKLHLDKAFEPDVPERAGGVKLIKPKRKYHDITGKLSLVSLQALFIMNSEWFCIFISIFVDVTLCASVSGGFSNVQNIFLVEKFIDTAKMSKKYESEKKIKVFELIGSALIERLPISEIKFCATRNLVVASKFVDVVNS